MLFVIDSSKIKGADTDSNKMSKNYGCQIAYFSKLRVCAPVNPWLTRALPTLGEMVSDADLCYKFVRRPWTTSSNGFVVNFPLIIYLDLS